MARSIPASTSVQDTVPVLSSATSHAYARV